MQKLERSSPFIRFKETPANRNFSLAGRLLVLPLAAHGVGDKALHRCDHVGGLHPFGLLPENREHTAKKFPLPSAPTASAQSFLITLRTSTSDLPDSAFAARL
jgi:hypothetical protein